jgi:hypothetical protein
MENEYYKCKYSGNPRKKNPRYKTPDKPKEKEGRTVMKSGYENDDITGCWGPESIWKK